MSAGLEVHDLTVTGAGGVVVLDGARLRAAPGRMVAVRGPSGCGKSTLLYAVLGALPPGLRRHGGTVRWAGDPLPTGRANRRWRRAQVGACAQESGTSLHPRRRVLDLVLEAVPAGRQRAQLPAARELLAALGLDAALHDRLPTELSGGQAQRVALARALLPGPALLVADEPTRGLDPAAAAAVHARFAALRAAGAVVLVATHDDVLAAAADQVVVLAPPGPDGGSIPAASGRGTAPGPVVLEVRDLVLAQPPGGAPILRMPELRLRAGERVAVLGASGSGKTTLLRTVAGLHPPEAGELRLDGEPLPASVRERDLAQRAAVQLVGQDPQGELNPAHRARTAVRRPLRVLRGLARADAADTADAVLDGLGLDPATTRRRPGALSGGQRQRVALGRALAVDPAVLLADEPTAALDATTSATLLAQIDAACAQGLAVLLATHDDDLARWADRRLRIVGDRLVEERRSDGPVDEPAVDAADRLH